MGGYKTFNTAVYLRLSRDDGIANRESESIQNQRDFLLKYVKDNDLMLTDIYVDDGWSGTNFDRPDFIRMINDIESGKINCVVTKDLSRLGRDYIMTGHYIEKYFPEHNVRYIAVNDGVDTFEYNVNNDITPFKAVFNDMYAKDISKKVRTALDIKKEKGEFIGSVAPYGYQKDPLNKHHLVIDEETAANVRRMYAMYLDGWSTQQIAKQFTKEGIPTPSQSKNLTATQRGIYKGVWNGVIIRRILTNPTYIGHITQNWVRKINYKVSGRIRMGMDDRITVKNTHEPIVTEEEYDMVQRLIYKKSRPFRDRKHHHLLSGLLECADCHRKMRFEYDRDGRVYAVCPTSRQTHTSHLCTRHGIREDKLNKEVIDQLRKHAELNVNKEAVISNCSQYDDEEKRLVREISVIESRIEQSSKVLTNLYIDKTKGIIDERDFVNIGNDVRDERDALVNRLSELEDRLAKIRSFDPADGETKKLLDKFLSFEDMDRNVLVTLIDKIEVFNDKTFKIYFNFKV